MVEVRRTRSGAVWRLFRGDEPIGKIHVTHGDFPWLNGRFVALDGFGDVRPLFGRLGHGPSGFADGSRW